MAVSVSRKWDSHECGRIFHVPSIALLCRLAAAMGVSVADFVNVSTRPSVQVMTGAEIPVLWQGDKGGSARLLAGSGGPDMVELWLWEMQPSEKFEPTGHPVGTFELLYVQAGTLTSEQMCPTRMKTGEIACWYLPCG